jgi:DNA-binding transcriptional regulator YhcF (GntR family)
MSTSFATPSPTPWWQSQSGHQGSRVVPGRRTGPRTSYQQPVPPYQVIAADLRAQIRAGSLKPGDRLPSTRTLEGQYGVANMTARKGLKVLVTEGLAYVAPGRGMFVDEIPQPSAPAVVALPEEATAPTDPESGTAREPGVAPAAEPHPQQRFEESLTRLEDLISRVEALMPLMALKTLMPAGLWSEPVVQGWLAPLYPQHLSPRSEEPGAEGALRQALTANAVRPDGPADTREKLIGQNMSHGSAQAHLYE